jgi:hypothetical protein
LFLLNIQRRDLAFISPALLFLSLVFFCI